MEVVKQSSLHQMMFTDKGFEITQNEKELEQRIEFAKTLFDLKFSEKDFQGFKFIKYENDLFSETLYSLGFRLYKDTTQNTLGSIRKSENSFRVYFYKPTIEDFDSTVRLKEGRKSYRIIVNGNYSLWKYKYTLTTKLCSCDLRFKSEEDLHNFEQEVLPKYKKQLLGYKEMYCKNCDNFIFLTQPLQFYWNNNKKEQFYFKLNHSEINGVITRLWVDKVVFFVDNLKITLYKEEVLKEDKIEAINKQIFTVMYKTYEIKVKKEEVE